MTNEGHDEKSVNRRNLLRGGAVLAGAAGATVVGAALLPTAANAAAPALLIGASNEGAATTGLTLTPAGASPALSLANAGGPSLRLAPISVDDDIEDALQVGEIVNTNYGPIIGVDYGDGVRPDNLVTSDQLYSLPITLPIPPQRLLDTRKVAGRESIVRKSSMSSLTSAGKLRAGQWIDVLIAPGEIEFQLGAIYATAAVIDPEKNGYLIVYPPDDTVPETSNINYQKGNNLSNAVFVPPGEFDGDYVVRIWTSQTTHLLFDISGALVSLAGLFGANQGGTRRAQRQGDQLAKIKKSLMRS